MKFSHSVVEPRLVGRVFAHFVLALAGVMLIPLLFATFDDAQGVAELGLAVGITLVSGIALLVMLRPREHRELRLREAILLTVLTWSGLCFFGCLPYYFSPAFDSLISAYFESVSAFTTTGATVLPKVEVLSRSLQLWRCFSQWLGGMGMVLLAVAILPLVGQGGLHLYRAEFSGAKSQKFAPRVIETARALWMLYVALTLFEILALLLAGMDGFDAVCHAFTTLSTGGFSTRTESIAGFHNAAVEYIVIVFMVLGGLSFVLHYRLWVERDARSVLHDYEFRYYLLIILAASALIALVLMVHDGDGIEHAVRVAMFQVVSILTTTGYVTADYAGWYPLAPLLLLILMFIGGCTGSTAGGLKVARVAMLGQVVDREIRRMVEPHGVFSIHVRGELIPEPAVYGLLNLVYLAWLLALFACLVVAASGVDVFSSLAAVVACMFNIGPGLGLVGPTGHYGDLPWIAKCMLCVCMIAGRLEFYTLLVVVSRTFWRR